MKIGVYGGSFNPCHLMHQKLVNRLIEKYDFDRIVILPTGDFYKKKNLLKGNYRVKMLELMFEGNPKVIISDYEFKNNLICTYRSLDYLQNLYKGDTLYFILGSDNLLEFHTWKRYEYILDTYNLFVIKRKNIEISNVISKYDSYKGDICCVDLDLDDISSSRIRDSLAQGDFKSIKSIVSPKVYSYILEKGFYQKNYKEESIVYYTDEEFLKHYDSDSYEKISITTDISLFSVSDIESENYRLGNLKSFGVLMVLRNSAPFYQKWCLPGGFLSLDETLLDCAKRVLLTETNLEDIYLEQLYTLSDIDRDIRARVLSCSYMGLVDKNLIQNQLASNAKFFTISLFEESGILEIHFKSDVEEFSCKVLKEVDSYGIISYKEVYNQRIAFDHLIIIVTSIERLRNKVKYTDLVFHMMPKEFTLKELQQVYEVILDKKLYDPVFRREIMDKVIKTKNTRTGCGHRPAALYRYKENHHDKE